MIKQIQFPLEKIPPQDGKIAFRIIGGVVSIALLLTFVYFFKKSYYDETE